MPTIRELRDENGWTQEQLAARVGAHWNTVARWERGEVMPDGQSRRLLELAFRVTAGEIDYGRPAARPDRAGEGER